MKFLLPILFLLLCSEIFAQDSSVHAKQDSTTSVQQIHAATDSSANDSVSHLSVQTNTTTLLQDSLKQDSTKPAQILPAKKIIQKKKSVQLMQGNERNIPDRDIIFYVLVFLLFFLGLVKFSFQKYFNSIFSLSFQAAFRQKQTKEQMSQNFFPAFMLNVLFILSGGIFITLFAEYYHYTNILFWQLFVYSTILLIIVYFTKDMAIRFTGWVFNAKEAATEYRFVVFLINKLIAVIIIPLLFLIAYSNDSVKKISITIVICLAIFSLVMRYLVSLSRIRKNLSVTAFHFFIYLCAVEIMPLLIIYKLLFLQTSNRLN